MPGGHASVGDHLADHGGMPLRILVVQQRKPTHLPRPVAGLALSLQDAGHIRGVGDGSHRSRCLLLTVEPRGDLGAGRPHAVEAVELGRLKSYFCEPTARHRRALHGDFLWRQGENRLEGIPQKSVACCRERKIVTILIVDGAAVAQPAPQIDQHHLVGSFHHEAIGDHIARIVEDREAGRAFIRPGLEIGNRVAGIRGDAKEEDPLLAILPRQLPQSGQVFFTERTPRRDKRQHGRFQGGELEPLPRQSAALGDSIEPDFLIGLHIAQAEIPHSAPHHPVDRQRLGLLGWCDPAGQQQKHSDQQLYSCHHPASPDQLIL